MSQVIKRTGEAVKFTWVFDPTKEQFIDEFRLETEAGAVVQGGIGKTLRELNAVVGSASESFRLAAVKGTLAAYAQNVVAVVVDNTPPAPESFDAE